MCITLLLVLTNGNVFLAYSAATLAKLSGPLTIKANAQSPLEIQYSQALDKLPVWINENTVLIPELSNLCALVAPQYQ